MLFISRLKHNFFLMIFERFMYFVDHVYQLGIFFCLWTEVIADKNGDGERHNSVVRSSLL